MIKIGITFDPPEEPIKMFSNGIRQNAFYLMELLINCGYDVHLIITPGQQDKIQNLYGFDSGRYKWVDYNDIQDSKFDVVIQFVFQIESFKLMQLKKDGVKLIAYNCGNEYIITMEEVLFNKKSFSGQQHVFIHEYGQVFDQIWSIPQMVNTNLSYWKTLYKCDAMEVPFIWSPLAIEQFEKENIAAGKGDTLYKNRGEVKKLGVFEPNLNIFKWSFPPLLVCENAYRIDKSKIGHVYCTNILDKKEPFNIDFFNKMVKPLDIFRDKVLSIEARYNTLYFMSKFCDIAVSHQWENPLNYLYLDLAWMGWPVLHNAHLCKDVGYYFEGFNYKQGGEVLVDIINNHDKSADEYLKRNRKIIDRYLPTNKSLQNKYKKLISNLVKKTKVKK
jgi:hypothetical protein